MSEPPPEPTLEYPPVDPTNFDLIIIGTGLPESIIAAAVSSAGKSVLHLDPHPFYGSHFSSLSLSDLSSFLLSPPPHSPPLTSTSSNDADYDVIPLASRSLYSDVEISPNLLEDSTKFTFDLSGPRALFCADSAINLMLKSGVNQYMEFKSVELGLIYDVKKGSLTSVPDSREAIFKGRSLDLIEKTKMTRFLKLVQEYLEFKAKGENENKSVVISEDDLESPFVDFMAKMSLPDKIKSIILYAIAMEDYNQENIDACKDKLKTKVGIDRLALYRSSMGRFTNAPGAMLYPMYGQGELPQAFCRRAAVKGCIYVLRMPVAALLAQKGDGIYKGVRLSSGQDLFSPKLVMGPHFTIPRESILSPSSSSEGFSQGPRTGDLKRMVARGICVTKTSMKPDATNLLMVFPPKSLYPEQETSVRVLQLGGGAAICPLGMFVLYLSALCDEARKGKKLLTATIDTLFKQPASERSETSYSENEDASVAQSASTEDEKPTLLWSALYIQEITEGSVETISTTPSPDGNLSYNDLVNISEKMFREMYPDEELFPAKASALEDRVKDGDGDNVDPES